MDPFIRDQLLLLKTRMVKNIELVGRHKIEELMDPDEFRKSALTISKLEAQEMHFMGAFEGAEGEADINSFQEKFDILIARPNEIDIEANPVVQRCEEFCREQFQKPDTYNDSQELAITEEQIATTDPFTKRSLNVPVVNRRCDHVYEKETIFELLGRSGRVRCPVVGCRNREYITKADLYEDVYISAQIRRQASNAAAAAESYADETVNDTEDFVQLNDTEL